MTTADNEIEVPASYEGFKTAQVFLENLMERHSVSKELAFDAMQVFEALFNSVMMQGVGPETTISIRGRSRLGDLSVKVGFEGGRFIPPEDQDGAPSPEARILKGYDDKISYRYQLGYNTVRISVKRTIRYLAPSLVGIVIAVVAYMLLSLVVDDEGRRELLKGYVYPLERLFANAVLMVGAPVVLFSLMKNVTDFFIVTERASDLGKLQVKIFVTTVICIVLALLVSQTTALLADFLHVSSDASISSGNVNWSFASFVTSMMSSNIVLAFGTASPFPLILVALLVAYSLCSVRKSFDFLKEGIDAGYELFAQMLRVVMALLPVACFFAFFDLLLDMGLEVLLDIAVEFGTVIVCLIPLMIIYAIRLHHAGYQVIPFVRKLRLLVRENIAIGSAIDAVSYNIRFCVRNYDMDRTKLERKMPVMAQMNLDGNCYIIMLVAMIYIIGNSLQVSWVSVMVICILAIFLSFGAPNEPGGILIGVLIISTYLGAFDMVPVAIYTEVLLGGIQNVVNVIGDVVVAAEEDAKD